MKLTFLFLLVLGAQVLVASELKREVWHKPVREYDEGDSVHLVVVDYAAVQKIKIAMTLEAVRNIVGASPLDSARHPEYAILATVISGEFYEVALLHRKTDKIQGISFRKHERRKA
jgi:hypothetical protein